MVDTSLGALTGLFPGRPRIRGINSGRHSDLKIFKEYVTKGRNGTARDVSLSTARRMLNGGMWDGAVVQGGAAGELGDAAWERWVP